MNPEAFLEVARMLALTADAIPANDLDRQDLRFALIRSAVSRAYYSVFASALSIGLLLDYPPPAENEGSSHAHLWNWLQEKDKKLASRCRALKRSRVKADYSIQMTFLVDPLDMVDQADEIIDRLAKLYAKLSRTQAP